MLRIKHNWKIIDITNEKVNGFHLYCAPPPLFNPCMCVRKKEITKENANESELTIKMEMRTTAGEFVLPIALPSAM